MEHDDECDCREYHHPILRVLVGIIVFVIVISIVLSVVGYVFIGGAGAMMSSGWHFLWGIIGLLFIIWLIGWIFGSPWRHHHRHWDWDEGSHAVRILKRRYAGGEISESEFKKMMKNLKEK